VRRVGGACSASSEGRGHGALGQVAAVAGLPLVVGLDQDGGSAARPAPQRVLACPGVDPLTGKSHYLGSTVGTRRDTESAWTRLLCQIDENRNPRARATVSQLQDRYLEGEFERD
jgi:hypothetical protein